MTRVLPDEKSNSSNTSNTSSKVNQPDVEAAYLCCSREDPKEFQVDLCPRKWFCCCSQDGSGGRLGCLRILWRILFVLFCLPLCYPCYVTRRCRRRQRRLEGVVVSSPVSPCFNRAGASHQSPEDIIRSSIRVHKIPNPNHTSGETKM